MCRLRRGHPRSGPCAGRHSRILAWACGHAGGPSPPGGLSTRPVVGEHLRRAIVVGVVASVALTACTSRGGVDQRPRLPPAHWVKSLHLPGVVDIGPRGDGALVVAAAGRLFILRWPGMVTAFARGPGGHSTRQGPEPYLTLAGKDKVPPSTSAVPPGTIFALHAGR